MLAVRSFSRLEQRGGELLSRLETIAAKFDSGSQNERIEIANSAVCLADCASSGLDLLVPGSDFDAMREAVTQKHRARRIAGIALSGVDFSKSHLFSPIQSGVYLYYAHGDSHVLQNYIFKRTNPREIGVNLVIASSLNHVDSVLSTPPEILVVYNDFLGQTWMAAKRQGIDIKNMLGMQEFFAGKSGSEPVKDPAEKLWRIYASYTYELMGTLADILDPNFHDFYGSIATVDGNYAEAARRISACIGKACQESIDLGIIGSTLHQMKYVPVLLQRLEVDAQFISAFELLETKSQRPERVSIAQNACKVLMTRQRKLDIIENALRNSIYCSYLLMQGVRDHTRGPFLQLDDCDLVVITSPGSDYDYLADVEAIRGVDARCIDSVDVEEKIELTEVDFKDEIALRLQGGTDGERKGPLDFPKDNYLRQLLEQAVYNLQDKVQRFEAELSEKDPRYRRLLNAVVPLDTQFQNFVGSRTMLDLGDMRYANPLLTVAMFTMENGGGFDVFHITDEERYRFREIGIEAMVEHSGVMVDEKFLAPVNMLLESYCVLRCAEVFIRKLNAGKTNDALQWLQRSYQMMDCSYIYAEAKGNETSLYRRHAEYIQQNFMDVFIPLAGIAAESGVPMMDFVMNAVYGASVFMAKNYGEFFGECQLVRGFYHPELDIEQHFRFVCERMNSHE